MKNLTSVAVLAAALLSLTGTGAPAAEKTTTGKTTATTTTPADINNAIEMARSLYQADKKAVVADNLSLTDTESQGFWKVYNEFQTELQKVGDQKLEVIKRYAANYESMTDQTAKSLLDDFFKAEKEELKVREHFRSKFMKVLPATKVARYYQIENKIASVVKMSLAQQIPLAQ